MAWNATPVTPQLSLLHEALHLFLLGFRGWLSDGNIPILLVSTQKGPVDVLGPVLNPYVSRPLSRDTVDR